MKHADDLLWCRDAKIRSFANVNQSPGFSFEMYLMCSLDQRAKDKKKAKSEGQKKGPRIPIRDNEKVEKGLKGFF